MIEHCPVCKTDLEIDSAAGQAYITEKVGGGPQVRIICSDHTPEMPAASVDRAAQRGDGSALDADRTV